MVSFDCDAPRTSAGIFRIKASSAALTPARTSLSVSRSALGERHVISEKAKHSDSPGFDLRKRGPPQTYKRSCAWCV
jgi:hypothetical protein